jgi:PleD family two-component response regulator
MPEPPPADRLSDVFSLGAMLEEMAGEEAAPDAFHHLVARATARTRHQRFQSMHDVAAALRGLATSTATKGEAPTILIVEDDETLRDVLSAGLSSEGYRVVLASNGRDAMRLAAEEAPHLVLLDVTLPGLNGFDVCRELRRRGFNAPIMIVGARPTKLPAPCIR